MYVNKKIVKSFFLSKCYLISVIDCRQCKDSNLCITCIKFDFNDRPMRQKRFGFPYFITLHTDRNCFYFFSATKNVFHFNVNYFFV